MCRGHHAHAYFLVDCGFEVTPFLYAHLFHVFDSVSFAGRDQMNLHVFNTGYSPYRCLGL
jgi:hypothetical protein